MNLHLLTIGKSKNKAIDSLFADYQKRLNPFMPLTLVELPHGKGSPEQIKTTEAASFRSRIPQNSLLIALDEKGDTPTTRQFAQKLQKWQDDGTRDITLLIGGAEGLDESIKKQADYVWSLSPLTFPHLLVRPILAEQLYRAATLMAGHPYHRD